MAIFPFNLFNKSLRTGVTADTTAIESSAWSVDVINALSDDYANLAKPYTDNPLIRAAIEAMRRNAGKALMQVGYVDEDGGFDCIEHPLQQLWPEPCPGETDLTLIEFAYSQLLDDGNAYVVAVQDLAGSAIRELQPIPFSWLQIPSYGQAIGEIVEYPFIGFDGGRGYQLTVPRERMLHYRTGKSTTTLARGRSPLESVRAELALIKLTSMYETTILSRAGVPSWLVSLTGTGAQMMTSDQIGVMQSDIKRAVSGKGVGRPLIFKGGELDIKTPGFSPKDLSVAEMTEIAVARVCGVLGWAPMTLKQPDTGKTYSNLVEANKASWRDAVIPFLELLATQLTRLVRTMPIGYGGEVSRPDERLSVRFDVSQIEELATDQKTVAERAVMLLNAGIVTVNEARQILGMAEMEEEKDDGNETVSNAEEQPEADTETEAQTEVTDAEGDTVEVDI
jgi:HK97 family phage portal protein